MKNLIYIVICLFGFSSCDYISEVKFKNAIIEGNHFADSSEYGSAINKYTLAQNYNDSSFVSYYNSGNVLIEDNYLDSALTNYKQAISYSNDSVELANIYYQMGHVNLTNHEVRENKINTHLTYLDSLDEVENKSIQERIRLNILKDSLLNINSELLKQQEVILNTAKQNYINSLSYNYKNDSAQYNYIYTLYLLKKDEESKGDENKEDEKKKEPTPFALKQKEKALELIKINKFQQAYSLLNKAKESDATVNTFKELIGKLKDINDIIEQNEK